MKKITLLICMIGLVTLLMHKLKSYQDQGLDLLILTDGSLVYNINDLPKVSKANPLIAQFGWQFEKQFMNTVMLLVL